MNFITQIENIMNISLILNKIKDENNFKTDIELADFLEISKSTLSNWRGRETLDWELVLSKCEHMNYNWLFKETFKVDNKKNDLKLNLLEEIKNIDEISVHIILEKYQELAIDYGRIKKENEELRNKLF
jgi:hypothetical protein